MIQISFPLRFYKSGIFNGDGCIPNKKPNHVVVAVGYNLNAKIPYILLQNSWGKQWGELGMFKLEIGKMGFDQGGLCSISTSRQNIVPILT